MTNRSLWIGYDSKENDACAVAVNSARRRMGPRGMIPMDVVSLAPLQESGIYCRPTTRGTQGRLIDLLSARSDYDGAISTEHALSRFLVPHLAKGMGGWAMFTDGDVLFRDDVNKVFETLDPSKALYCVHHDYAPKNTIKKDDQLQTQYLRKNWSSVMIFNCDHPSNERITVDVVNEVPGLYLHRFYWLEDREIGALDHRWNHLVGHSVNEDPAIVHYTEGTPDLRGYEGCEYAQEWRDELKRIRG